MTEIERIKEVSELLERGSRPYAAEYVRKYGVKSQMTRCYLSDAHLTEQLYKKCLKEGVRWEDIYEPEIIPEGVVL